MKIILILLFSISIFGDEIEFKKEDYFESENKVLLSFKRHQEAKIKHKTKMGYRFDPRGGYNYFLKFVFHNLGESIAIDLNTFQLLMNGEIIWEFKGSELSKSKKNIINLNNFHTERLMTISSLPEVEVKFSDKGPLNDIYFHESDQFLIKFKDLNNNQYSYIFKKQPAIGYKLTKISSTVDYKKSLIEVVEQKDPSKFKSIEDAVLVLKTGGFRERKDAEEYLWQKYPESQKALKEMLLLQDPELKLSAKKILNRIAEGDQPDNLQKAITLHYKGETYVQNNFRRFLILGKGNDPVAKMWLARIYFKGRSGAPELPFIGQVMASEVLSKVRKLAESGDREAQFLIGVCFYEGLVYKQNRLKGIDWFKKAAKQGHVIANSNLGIIHQWGIAVEPDWDLAVKYFKKAEPHGCKSAKTVISQIVERDIRNEKKLSEVRKSDLVKILGMEFEPAIKLLRDKKIITSSKFSGSNDSRKNTQSYDRDGVSVRYDYNAKRIDWISVSWNGKRKESIQAPLDIPWGITVDELYEKLGPSEGKIKYRGDYAQVYISKNLNILYTFDRKTKKLFGWTVFENWATNYK